ncbi:hypothetical protein DPMN_098268 [Dreissena polymorpha]|uniref:Uncharacterized protein n=1 Tax=Dreissena polymorpha TaxID=45954 RepID=A0A9D4LC06_DREPO|nr:hypothetical protein DPMN_098268 [Dreissena polymorpha]
MCQTIEKKGKEGYISKMCVSPDMCTDRCTTDKCEACCVGQLCNRGNDENNNGTAGTLY